MEEVLDLSKKELFQYVKKNIKYGFVDKKGKKYFQNDLENVDIDELYVLQSPNEVISNKCAWCWDIVELYRYYFENNVIKSETYYLQYKNDKLNIHNTHTFIIYNENKKWYSIDDNSSSNDVGIFEYNSKQEAIDNISNLFKCWIKEINNLDDLSDGYILNQYSKPKYGISAQEFQAHCQKSK